MSTPRTLGLELQGSLAYIDPDFLGKEDAVIRHLRSKLAVRVATKRHPNVAAGLWDGYEYLLRPYGGKMAVPIGLLDDLRRELKQLGHWTFDIVDKRPIAPELNGFARFVGEELDGDDYRKLRDYQEAAVVAATAGDDPFAGNGILAMPVRSGKTLVSCKLIEKFQTPTIFVTPNKTLLGQTYKVFSKYLSGVSIGRWGDGIFEPGDVTVATIQSLIKDPIETMRLFRKAGLLIIDEHHHQGTSGAWRNLLLKCPIRHKIGLTGTPPVVGSNELSDDSAVWMRACTGPILYRVSMQRLIREGILKAPTILFYSIFGTSQRLDMGEVDQARRWNELYKRGIVQNNIRNRAIAQLAAHSASLGLRVLIDVGKVEHIENISEILDTLGQHHEVSHGKKSLASREELFSRISSGETLITVGTIFGEGVDVPELEVVINGEGLGSPDGNGRVASIQRLRNLTTCPGKGHAIVVDFMDVFSPTLEKHSDNRLSIYQSIRGFEVREATTTPGAPYRLPQDVVDQVLAKVEAA